MADRYRALEAYIHDCIETTLNETNAAAYEELMPVLETSGARLKKYFVRVLIEQFDRATASELSAHNIPQKLAELQEAEERARARQYDWLENPAAVSRSEQPVILPRLSTRELVDCQLREARQGWLDELQRRLSDAKSAATESRARVEQQSDAIQRRLDNIQLRIAELEKARDVLNASDGPEKPQ